LKWPSLKKAIRSECGWIQIYVENAQEGYDWTIQAFKIAEDQEVQLPISVNLDGFIIVNKPTQAMRQFRAAIRDKRSEH
jgi:pyruvate/2-oxoacid:ferredoxin oxidoreductase alpha subunit